jgi:uncharacterized membrane protein YgcG
MRILPVVLCAVAFGAAWAQCEEITGFESRVEIERGGDVRVTETIAVVAGGEKIKRGIYRDFPTLYRSVLGLRRSVDFEVTGVLRDGVPEPWHSEGRANGVRIYIGEAGRLIDHGPHTYTLSYRTNRQLVLHDDFDEFYWNVTGNGWDFPIARAKVKITLPPGAPLRSAEAYTGPGGARGTAWRVVTEAGADVVIETTAPLAPGEGLTVSVTWPKGYVDADANPRDLAAVAGDNPFTAASLAALVLVLAYYMIAWVVIGRDPPRGVIIPRYAPPEGFTPSAVRFLAGLGRVDDKSFAAAVLQLAVSGALRIREGKVFHLERTEKAPDLPKGQRAFFEALLGSRKELPLEQGRHTVLRAARKALAAWLASDFEKAYFKRNAGVWIGGLLLSLVPAVLALFEAREFGIAAFMAVWLSFWSLGVIGLLSSVFSMLRSGRFLAALPLAVFSLPFLAGWVFGAWMLLQATSVLVVAVFATGAALNMLFYHLLKAPTLHGRAILDQIEGFRHYLGVAESDRLNLENPPDRTPAVFEKFLPYALALDVEHRWAAQFSEVLAASDYRPAWYSSGGLGGFSAVGLVSSLGGGMVQAIASSSTAPGSSGGSGGGGSSGGGGGGGGGGGW